MAKEPLPLAQPPWESIVRETLKANDPARTKGLTSVQERQLVSDLAERAARSYSKIVAETEKEHGPVEAWKLGAIEEIVMEQVILEAIPRPQTTLDE